MSECIECGHDFDRKSNRGREPVLCPDCRERRRNGADPAQERIDALRKKDRARMMETTRLAAKANEPEPTPTLPEAQDGWLHKCPAEANLIVRLPDETDSCPRCGRDS